MKEPLEIGTFLHRSHAERVLLIVGRKRSGKRYTYNVDAFSYFPKVIGQRLKQTSHAFLFTSSWLEQAGWQPVDVSKGELAR